MGSGDRYEGTFAHGERDGYGVCQYANGDRYEGYWTGGIRGAGGGLFQSSVSTLPSTQRDEHVGDWREDQQSAMGMMEYADGRVYQGLVSAVLCCAYSASLLLLHTDGRVGVTSALVCACGFALAVDGGLQARLRRVSLA